MVIHKVVRVVCPIGRLAMDLGFACVYKKSAVGLVFGGHKVFKKMVPFL
jgi:hypothetical protein